MEKNNYANNLNRLEIIYKTFFSFCALCCFLAVFPLPIIYYTLLRIVVSIGALIVVYHFGRQKEFLWFGIFAIVLILFNPIFPIHFYLKSVWIPIDIVTGILFLLIIFIKKKVKEIPQESIPKTSSQQKTYRRDRIIKTSSKKQ